MDIVSVFLGRINARMSSKYLSLLNGPAAEKATGYTRMPNRVRAEAAIVDTQTSQISLDDSPDRSS